MANYIRFDWAMKRLLRDKANFSVLEGLLTTLLNEKITIRRLLESESNQESEFDQVQPGRHPCRGLQRYPDSLRDSEQQRVRLFPAHAVRRFQIGHRIHQPGRRIREHPKDIQRQYRLFRLGSGSDTVYHGQTEFRGIHTNELLCLSPFQQETFKATAVSQLYPEYYILRVNDFNKWSKVPLEQWIYFLNTGEIPDDASAPGLPGGSRTPPARPPQQRRVEGLLPPPRQCRHPPR